VGLWVRVRGHAAYHVPYQKLHGKRRLRPVQKNSRHFFILSSNKKWLVFLSPGAGYRLKAVPATHPHPQPHRPKKKNGRVSGERKKTSPTFLTGRACFFSFRRRAVF
jgi:hypothetical protein